MDSVSKPDALMIQAWQAYLDHKVQQGELTRTLKRTYMWGFAQFIDWLELQQEQQISAVMLRRWVEGLRAQGHTSFSVDFWIECVGSFFSWAKSSGLISFDPTAGVTLGRQRPTSQG